MNPFDKPTCGFACPEEHRCLAHGHEIPETANFYNCDVCNTPIINPIVDVTLNKILCERCYNALGIQSEELSSYSLSSLIDKLTDLIENICSKN